MRVTTKARLYPDGERQGFEGITNFSRSSVSSFLGKWIILNR